MVPSNSDKLTVMEKQGFLGGPLNAIGMHLVTHK